jgi:hypothetical protein
MSSSDLTVAATWEECRDKIRQIEAENSASLSGVWYRGLSQADWPLETTLERRRKEPFVVKEYFDLMLRTLPEVESLTGQRWERGDLEWSDPKTRFADYFRNLPAFGYMAHLRHHGFPSPLLDWSRSPYVAAYFAFARAEPVVVKDVAIFAFSETPNNSKSTDSRKPQICGHGGFALRTHARHFRQQSCYTVCVERIEPDTPGLVLDCGWRFVRHQEVFMHRDEDQDKLYKIEIPSTERTKVLALLDRFNLNEFSLFGSEESLMESLAFRFIDKNAAFRAPPV